MRDVVLKVALFWPPTTLNVPVPNVFAPSLKVTVPVGVPPPGLFTVTMAVKVTNWPEVEGLVDDETVVVVFAVLTVWMRAGSDVLLLNVLSPR